MDILAVLVHFRSDYLVHILDIVFKPLLAIFNFAIEKCTEFEYFETLFSQELLSMSACLLGL